MSPLVKLMWFKECAPDVFKRAYKFISIKEYVLYQWFHQYVVDYSIASATGLFSLQTFDWDEEILTFLGIERSQLSSLVPTTYTLQGMDKNGLNSSVFLLAHLLSLERAMVCLRMSG